MAENPEMTFVEDSGRGWRRVVASPEPKKIVEADSILNLLDNEFIVIACGGGGIPVVRDYDNKGCYKGVAAVIDKDMGGELLAEDCSADVLFLLTAVEHVAINFGKPDQQELEELTADEAERLADEGQFGKGSMEPKVRAAIKFARSRDYDNKGCYKGVAAVIDKDMGGELLAEDCSADVLFLLTAVEHVAINFGKPDQQELEELTADEAERLADEGQFGKGSMEPKVRAAIKFARSRKGRTCIIGALDKAAETMAGLSGTRICG